MPASSGRIKVKLSQILDGVDETEVDLLDQPEIDLGFAQLKVAKGDLPTEDSEPTPGQFSAFHHRVVLAKVSEGRAIW